MDFIVIAVLFSGCFFFGFLPIRRQREKPLARFYLLCLCAALAAGLLVSAHVSLPNPMAPFLALARYAHIIK
jgi:hypothetical protein